MGLKVVCAYEMWEKDFDWYENVVYEVPGSHITRFAMLKSKWIVIMRMTFIRGKKIRNANESNWLWFRCFVWCGTFFLLFFTFFILRYLFINLRNTSTCLNESTTNCRHNIDHWIRWMIMIIPSSNPNPVHKRGARCLCVCAYLQHRNRKRYG